MLHSCIHTVTYTNTNALDTCDLCCDGVIPDDTILYKDITTSTSAIVLYSALKLHRLKLSHNSTSI